MDKAKKPELLINFGSRVRGSHLQSWFVSFQCAVVLVPYCVETQTPLLSLLEPLDESSRPSNANAKLMQIIMHCPQHHSPMKQSSQIC